MDLNPLCNENELRQVTYKCGRECPYSEIMKKGYELLPAMIFCDWAFDIIVKKFYNFLCDFIKSDTQKSTFSILLSGITTIDILNVYKMDNSNMINIINSSNTKTASISSEDDISLQYAKGILIVISFGKMSYEL